MKKFTHRLLPLVLCFTLTLGAFAYRPSEAKAIAGVDDAVVIGALLTAFAGGMGLIFSNKGMTSGQIANGMTDKWNEYNQSVNGGTLTFPGWLGYDSIDDLWSDIKLTGKSSFTIPVIVARRLAEFTKWFAQELGITSGGEEKPAISGGSYVEVDGTRMILSSYSSYKLSGWYYFENFSAGTLIPFPLGVYTLNKPLKIAVADGVYYRAYQNSSGSLRFSGEIDGVPYSTGNGNAGLNVSGDDVYLTLAICDGLPVIVAKVISGGKANYYGFGASVYLSEFWSALQERPFSPSAAGVGVQAPSGVKNPALDDENATPTVTGVGWDASTIEELLQQILAQVEANTLAPTLEGVDTNTGGNTGTDTDEDAKPYLPYIPQIFEKIKELPGTLTNIWESIKGIPAAIAEKTGAFFTTLWGWLQSIIDAIKALPAAIAEKIGALFKPDEALLTEITDTFKGKFGFFSTLKQFGSDLFGMTPETEPPVIWVHLENAESKFGYNYGDKQKIFDMTWYQKYKASVDGLLSGFLWLGYLWLLFKRAPSILNGMQMDEDLRPPLLVGDVSSAPRLGAGDPSMHYGEGFTFRSKGGKRK